MGDDRPIGVFDSGVGGLTVLNALTGVLPEENFLYLGDTARLPYGAKTADTVRRYSAQCAARLVERNVKALVVACNTASAVALDVLAGALAPLPVIGVLEPGADAAVAASASGAIAVLATEGTIRGGAYERAIRRRRPASRVTSIACPLFVALAEEGLVAGPIVSAVIERYLAPLRASDVDTVLLGCTHFPLLAAAIGEVLGPAYQLVDSAATTATAVAERLGRLGLLRAPGSGAARTHFLATDGAERFARVGSLFYRRELPAGDVELVELSA